MPRLHPSALARDERFWIATGVTVLHLWAVGWLLFHYAPPARPIGSEEATTLVYFIPRQESPGEAAVPAAPPLPPSPRRHEPSGPAPTTAASPSGASAASAPDDALTLVTLPRARAGTAQLQLPDDYVEIQFKRHDGVTGDSLALDPRTTRFSDDWATDGDIIEKLKENHVAVSIALNLFGGRDGCTERALRERRKGCVGKDYQPEMHEAVQGR